MYFGNVILLTKKMQFDFWLEIFNLLDYVNKYGLIISVSMNIKYFGAFDLEENWLLI